MRADCHLKLDLLLLINVQIKFLEMSEKQFRKNSKKQYYEYSYKDTEEKSEI